MSTTIALIRHGDVENPDALYYGRLPSFTLSQPGRRQAEAARDHLQHQSPAAIFSSPLTRARQTAEIIGQTHPGLDIQLSDLLHEVHSPFDGSSEAVMAARNWDLHTGVGPEYEQPSHILERVQRFLAEVRRQYPGQLSLAVTHRAVIAFTAMWTGGLLPADQYRDRLVELGISDGYPFPASITSLIYTTQDPAEIPTLAYNRPFL
jgi:broad specificity phosphatase PhoE